jgi:para-nitrobenzyl esterase
MAHPDLTAESPNNSSGNYGQLDLIAALQWVQRNIAAFGGDPNNVTIWGHSGGGAKTNFLLASPLTKGLFHRAICEAGFSTAGRSLAIAEWYGGNLATKLSVTTIEEMRALPWKDIVDAAYTPPYTYSSQFTVDGWSLPDTIGNIFAAGDNHDVPYMVGMGGAEIGSTTPRIGQLLQIMSEKQKSPIYTYVFTHVPINWAEAGVYAYHGLEVSYQYGVVDTAVRIYGTSLLPYDPDVPADPGINENDYWLQDAVMTMWTQFAKKGNPSVKSLGIKWPKYDSRDRFLDIGVPPLVSTGFSTLVDDLPPR